MDRKLLGKVSDVMEPWRAISDEQGLSEIFTIVETTNHMVMLETKQANTN